jgi:transcriptional regulator with XRE-family HTH domain
MERDFARAFRALQKQSGKTGVEIAREMGVSNAMIVRYRNYSVTPHLATLERIAKTFDMTVSQLRELAGRADI